jgi:hypothetical protein
MSDFIGWMAAEAERPPFEPDEGRSGRREEDDEAWARRARERRMAREMTSQVPVNIPSHQFPQPDYSGSTTAHPFDALRLLRAGSPAENAGRVGQPEVDETESQNPNTSLGETETLAQASTEVVVDEPDVERQRRIYRGRTVGMLRRYMRYSIETGRLPSLLGREFFRSKVTSYSVTTFEDRVIFVHDMEMCLEKLDEFSRQILARHILQEHDQPATARLLGCSERTVRSYVPMALDLLSEILLEVGLLERSVSKWEKPCQGGNSGPFSVSDCEEGENKF